MAVYLTALAGLLTAVTPAVANMDTTSTAGMVTGGLMILGVAVKWLDGWQKHEQHLQHVANDERYWAREREVRGTTPTTGPHMLDADSDAPRERWF